VDDHAVQAFLDAGFIQRQILEVILGVSQKVMSNYTNHLANTPVDKPFQKLAWQNAAQIRPTVGAAYNLPPSSLLVPAVSKPSGI
jgi:hypothetical protein